MVEYGRTETGKGTIGGPSTRWVLDLQEPPYEGSQVADSISNGAMYTLKGHLNKLGILDEAFCPPSLRLVAM